MAFRFEEPKFGHYCTLYSLPGVPFEAIGALPDVLDDIKTHFSISDIHHKTVMTFGIPESVLAKTIESWEDALPEDMHLAYLPDPIKGVRLRLSIYGGAKEEQEARIEAEMGKLREILGDVIWSEQDDSFAALIGRMLTESGKTMSAAESCTGGMISELITSVSGSSAYYLGSVTSYANSVKTGVLQVPEEIIREHGAVSSECVAKMAEGVRKITGSDFSVATSGIAGPGGGSEQKPVGLVWIAVSSDRGTETFSHVFKNDRKRNIERFAAAALNHLRKKIQNELKD
jgi:nicotinamide-nucleotide amidase